MDVLTLKAIITHSFFSKMKLSEVKDNIIEKCWSLVWINLISEPNKYLHKKKKIIKNCKYIKTRIQPCNKCKLKTTGEYIKIKGFL